MDYFPSGFEERCLVALKQAGSRVTEARRAVIKVLSQSKKPLAPKDILSRIEKSKTLGDIDPVSVYRVLDCLLQLNLIHSVSPEGRYIACEHINCQAPIHLLTKCEACGKTDELDLPVEVITPLLQYLNKRFRFTPLNHHFQLDGTCHLCRS